MIPNVTNRRRIAATAAGLTALALTGCGGGAKAGGAKAGGNTITLGVLAPFTGPNAQSATDLMKGINLAVKEVVGYPSECTDLGGSGAVAQCR